MRKGIIYKVTNLINGKIYIGKTMLSLKERRNRHIYNSLKENRKNYFHRSIRKYGKENFKWEIVYECDDELLLNVMETMKIIVNHSYVTEGGYNLTWGGEGSCGYKPTEETKKRLSEMNKGKSFTTGHKEKISHSLKGHNVSKDTKMKISKANKGKNHPMYGKHHTEETKQKMKETKIGEKSSCSKSYIIEVAKTGELFYITGLNNFCRTHQEYKADAGALSKCAMGKSNIHKGLKCKYNDKNTKI